MAGGDSKDNKSMRLFGSESLLDDKEREYNRGISEAIEWIEQWAQAAPVPVPDKEGVYEW